MTARLSFGFKTCQRSPPSRRPPRGPCLDLGTLAAAARSSEVATISTLIARSHLKNAFEAPVARRTFDSGARAAVAAVFREGEAGTELLFIERAARKGDPWSGQMAFPGGRVEPTDADLAATAERETFEEVGLNLSPAERLGQLHELDGRARRIIVSPHGYWLEGPRPELSPNHEVANVFWVSLADLADPQRHIEYQYPGLGVDAFPGILLGEGPQVIWGMTLRMLVDLFDRLGRPLPLQR